MIEFFCYRVMLAHTHDLCLAQISRQNTLPDWHTYPRKDARSAQVKLINKNWTDYNALSLGQKTVWIAPIHSIILNKFCTK